jgi:hypothetical protein
LASGPVSTAPCPGAFALKEVRAMSATVTPDFIHVEGRLEPAAVANAITGDIHGRIGEFLVVSARELDEADMPLTELQHVKITSAAAYSFDGIRREVLDVIIEHLQRVEVAVTA